MSAWPSVRLARFVRTGDLVCRAAGLAVMTEIGREQRKDTPGFFTVMYLWTDRADSRLGTISAMKMMGIMESSIVR